MAKSLRGYKYTHERKNRRVDTPIQVKIDGGVYQAKDWSFGGILVEDYEGTLEAGWETRVEAVGLPEGGLAVINLMCRVVRVDRTNNTLAIAFDALSERAYNVFEGLTMNRLRT